MLEILKKNFIYFVVAILAAIILLQRSCNNPNPITPKPKIVTVIQIKDSIIHDTLKGKPIFISSKKDTSWVHDTAYIPSANYDDLLKQYDQLGDKYFSTNVYKTPFSLGKFGSVNVTDTIVANRIKGSDIKYTLNIPETTKTITIHDPYVPQQQIYIGGSLQASQYDGMTGGEIGLIYKNKKDQLYQVKAIFNKGTGLSYGVGTYWKIKL